jgi:carbamoyl-phosphate synthase large subunit
MAICDSPASLGAYLGREQPEGELLVDRFLEGATEFDVDALSDGSDCWIAAVMQHVEAAGIHSGDSACVLPPQDVTPGLVARLEEQVRLLAGELGAVGLLNVQFAVRGEGIYIIEANPRASRTVPFVAKATGVPLVRHALRLMLGTPLSELRLPTGPPTGHIAVKEAVLPFNRFVGADPVLGPEMRATGEVMGVGDTFAEAFSKAQRGAGQALPRTGNVFISARDADKPQAVAVATALAQAGLGLIATSGTARALSGAGLPVREVRKISEGSPNVGELIRAGEVDLVINTPRGGFGARTDGFEIRAAAIRANIPCITTIEAARAAALAIVDGGGAHPRALQDLVPSGGAPAGV